MATLGGAIDAACSTHQDVRSAAPHGSQRQSDGLAVPAVSVRLVRNELILQKRNAAQAEYHRLAASVRYWALKSPILIGLRRQPKVRSALAILRQSAGHNPLKYRAEVAFPSEQALRLQAGNTHLPGRLSPSSDRDRLRRRRRTCSGHRRRARLARCRSVPSDCLDWLARSQRSRPRSCRRNR